QTTPDAKLRAEMFQTAQWAQSSEAAQSLQQMAARGAKGDLRLAALVRERQDLVAEWQQRDGARSAPWRSHPTSAIIMPRWPTPRGLPPSTRGLPKSTRLLRTSSPTMPRLRAQRRFPPPTCKLCSAPMRRWFYSLTQTVGTNRLPRRPLSG